MLDPATSTDILAVGLREVVLNDRKFEAAMKKATVSDERAGNSRRSFLKSTVVFAQHSDTPSEINISGNQVLLALATAFCVAGPIVWAFVKYWLFAL